jgi:hypothetical protein
VQNRNSVSEIAIETASLAHGTTLSADSPIFTPMRCDPWGNPVNCATPPSCREWNVEDHNIQNMTPQSFLDFPTPRSDDSSFQYEDDLTLFTESVKTPTAHPRKAKQVRIRTNFGCKDPGSINNGNVEKLFNSNANGWTSSTKIESTIQTMIDHNIGAATLQETWCIGDYEREIRGFLVLHHNYNEREPDWTGRERRGVAIILSPRFRKAYERAGSLPPIKTPQDNPRFKGCFIGVTLRFPNFDSYGKRIKGNSTFFLTSIYHPYEPQHYDDFNDLVATLLSQSPPKATILIGHDINADVGTKLTPDSADFSDVLGPHGFNKRN